MLTYADVWCRREKTKQYLVALFYRLKKEETTGTRLSRSASPPLVA
jgi:hypothetical protein